MQIIVKRKGNKRKSSSASNKMAKKKSSTRKKSSSSGVFSGKIFGIEVPIVSKVMRNKTFQKAAAGAGTVSLALSIASLVNNPTVNRVLSKKEARIALAAAGGDIVGAGAQFVKEGGIAQVTGQTSSAQNSSQAGFA